MWKVLCISMLLFAQVLCETEKNDVQVYAVELTKETFKDAITNNNHFVMFFAPWCGHSKKMIPIWEQLAKNVNMEERPVVIVSKVDCTVHQEVCSQNEVTGYPTLRFFKIGREGSVKFRGIRDISTLTNFINEQLGSVGDLWDSTHESLEEEDGDELEVPQPMQRLVELNEENFAKHISSGKHFVKFYAPWCGHCQRLAPTWEDLAKSLEHDKVVSIAKIDCTLYRPICQDFEVKGYPTLLWIEDGKKIEKYSGSRSHEELKAYVEKMVGISRSTVNEVDDDTKSGDTSSVAVLSSNNFKNAIEKGVTFVKFYAPWCGHCQKLAPVWEQLGVKLIGKTGVKVAKVDCTSSTNKELCMEQQVEGYPTLFIYKNGEKLSEYAGNRQLDDLYSFVTSKGGDHDEL